MDRKYNIVADEAAERAAGQIAAGYTEERLISASNKGIYKRALKDIDGAEVKIYAQEGGVNVVLSDAEVVMSADISECRCSCPSKTVCRHIISAAIILSQFSRETSAEEKVPEPIPEEKHTEEKQDKILPDEKYLAAVKSTVSGIISKGIISCGRTDMDELSRLAATAPTVHRDIGRMCRSAAADIGLMLERSTGFSALPAAMRLCRIYNTADVSAKPQGEPLLFSGSDYEPMGKGDFLCLGIYPHRSKSGFAGVTAVMFELSDETYYTYNVGVADIYSKTENAGSPEALEKLTKAHSHWQNNVSLKMISGKRLSLIGFKADKSNKISSSKQTVCAHTGRLTAADIPEAARRIPPEEEYDYFAPVKKPRFAAVTAERITGVNFDTTEQVLYYTVEGADIMVHCITPYSELTDKIIRYIEAAEGSDMKNTAALIRFFGGGAELISLIDDGGVHNIFFGMGE